MPKYVPQRYADFEAEYAFKNGLIKNLSEYFSQVTNGLEPGGKLGRQHGYANGDPNWAGKPLGENVAGGNRAIGSPYGPDPFALTPANVPVPVEADDLRDDQKTRRKHHFYHHPHHLIPHPSRR